MSSRQAAAMFIDSIRLVRSRSLFWITLALTTLAAVSLFGVYTFTPQGMQILWFEPFDNPALSSADPEGPRSFVAGVFNDVYVRFWLGFGAIILAIFSTASILPDFLTSGSVDLALSKPISRVRLFILKVLGALAFVVLQVTLSVWMVYMIVGLRFDLWMHAAFWAVPLITLQFFYIYSFGVLVAIVTRSTLASLIGMSIFWFAAIIVQLAAGQFEQAVTHAEVSIERSERRVELIELRAQDEERELRWQEKNLLTQIAAQQEQHLSTLRTFGPVHSMFRKVEFFIPKTSDAQKILATKTKAPVLNEFMSLIFSDDAMRPPSVDEAQWREMKASGAETQLKVRDVDPLRSIGSSMAVSCLLVGMATVIFIRRDF